ncbi:MAG: glycosyltransferase family 2 protein [Candidatus Thorarchaeota archaeon]|nr:glycosyltransferase family 2 protein [Candidatus Thorarchaeota archaeon]
MGYVLVTNIFNEAERIQGIIDNILLQSMRPTAWVWIDDGSTDGGIKIVERFGETGLIPIKSFRLPAKKRGNLDTIGRAWNVAHPYIRQSLRTDYLAVTDVDTRYPKNYFERVCDFMDRHPSVGAASGNVRGRPYFNPTAPMGCGKVIRWSIIDAIESYWDMAPDSYFNIKAAILGYGLASFRDLLIESPPATMYSKKGRLRYGRCAYYTWLPLPRVLGNGLKDLLKSRHGSDYLRGFWQEWSRGEWRCTDPDVKRYFSMSYLLTHGRKLKKRCFSSIKS